MKVNLKAITPNIEDTIVEIARVSSSRKDKKEKPEGLINYLIKNWHWSPFEHGFITMEIETSKAIGIQAFGDMSNRIFYAYGAAVGSCVGVLIGSLIYGL